MVVARYGQSATDTSLKKVMACARWYTPALSARHLGLVKAREQYLTKFVGQCVAPFVEKMLPSTALALLDCITCATKKASWKRIRKRERGNGG